MLVVRDVMRQDVIRVSPTTPLKDVAQILIDRRISGVPVVDAHGTVLGVVSETDFLIKEQGAQAIHHRQLARLRGESAETREMVAKQAAVTAGEAMTSPAITIEPWTAITKAAEIMTTNRVNRLPVVDDNRIVGIVTRADLLRAYVRSDAELANTIRVGILQHVLWLDPAGFKVDVRDGIAFIEGRVERRSTAEMVERSTAMVPGVIDVRASILWSVEDRDVAPVDRDLVSRYGAG